MDHVDDAENWLSDSEQRTWRLYRSVTQRIDAELDRQLERDASMPHAYYAILVLLSEADQGRRRMSELAADLGFSTSRLTHAVNALAKRGWVSRERCEDDGRGQFAVIQPEGRAALAAAAPAHVAEVRRLVFEPLSQRDLADLTRVLNKLERARPSGRASRRRAMGS